MALITCPECKKQVSETADACPNCGYKFTPEKKAQLKKQEKEGQKIVRIGCFSVIGIVLIIAMFNSCPSGDKKTTAPKTAKETRTEQIEEHFSKWDGSHRGLTNYIKKSMNDPDSYKHEKTVYFDRGDYLLVETTFRGKNAFGALVKNSVTAKVDLNGNVIEIISKGP